MGRHWLGRNSLAAASYGPGGNGYGTPNLLTFSEAFSDGVYWATTNATVTDNTTVAPDGTTTGDTLTDDATNSRHNVIMSGLVPSPAAATLSIYAKAGTSNYINLMFASTLKGGVFNLSNGTVTFTSAGHSNGIIDAGGGWYRCWSTGAADPSGEVVGFLMNPSGASTVFNAYSGSGSTIIIWGAQFQSGPLGPYHRKP